MILTSLRRRVDALSDRVHGLLQEQENRKGAEDRFARQLCGDLTRLRVNYANALRSGHVSSQERLQFDAQHLAIQKDLLRILRGDSNFSPVDKGLSQTTQQMIRRHLKKSFTDRNISPTREVYGDRAYEQMTERNPNVRWVAS